MKKLMKDTAMFGTSSVMVGGLGMAAAPLGGGAGIATMSGMMPVVGQTMMAGHAVRLSSKLMDQLPKMKLKK